MAYIMRHSGKNRKFWKTHCHAKLVPPVHCWADAFYPGEELSNQLYGEKYFYIKILDPVYFQIDANGLTSGLAHYFLPQFVRGTRNKNDMKHTQPTESLLAMCAVHDVNTTGSYLNTDALGEYWTLQKDLGIEDAKFFPYWYENCPVTSSEKDILLSAYKTKSSWIVVIANRKQSPRNVSVKVNLDKMRISEKSLKVYDERTHKELNQENGIIKNINIKGYNYTFISIKYNGLNNDTF